MGDETIVGDRFIYKPGVFNRGYDIIDTEDDAMTVVAHCATGADATFVTRLMNAGHVFKQEVLMVVTARGISRDLGAQAVDEHADDLRKLAEDD